MLLIGFVAFYARGGRPISVRLKGLGIVFELHGRESGVTTNKQL